MKIKIERSGGFAGIPLTKEMDSSDLPLSLIRKAKKIIEDNETSSIPAKSYLKGTADHYNYKISIQDGETVRVIKCNQHDIGDDLKLIVTYVERNSIRNKVNT